MYVSSGMMLSTEAYISRESGEIFYVSDDPDLNVGNPKDLDNYEKYIEVPGKVELGIGKRVVFQFVSKVMPEKLDEVERIFCRKGAYSRFRSLLERNRKLEEWYKYESESMKKELGYWAEEEGFELEYELE